MGNIFSQPSDMRVRGGASGEDYSDDDDDDAGTVAKYYAKDNSKVQEAPGDKPTIHPQLALKCVQKRDLETPKRAMSPYNYFIKAQMKDNGKGRGKTGDMTHRMGTLASQWKSMSDDDKAPYVQAAAEDRQRYINERAKYESDKSQIIKRPVNGYIVFMREFRKQQKGNYKDAKELVREGAKIWKRLNNEQKLPFNQESREDSDRYAQERFHWCNKIVVPRKNDTRFSKEEMASQEEAHMEMETASDSDDHEMKEWMKKHNPKP